MTTTTDSAAIRAALAAMRARVEAATPGPWGDQTSLPHLEPGVASWHPEGGALICCDPDGDDRDADRRFIANARQDVPALLSVAEAAGGLLDYQREGGPDFPDWERYMDKLDAALAALAEEEPPDAR